jgi:hypothetical protein
LLLLESSTTAVVIAGKGRGGRKKKEVESKPAMFQRIMSWNRVKSQIYIGFGKNEEEKKVLEVMK